MPARSISSVEASLGIGCNTGDREVISKTYHARGIMQIKHLAVITFVLIGCEGKSGGPTSKELRNRLAVELPGYVRTSSFNVEASQNIGSEVEPVFKSRFKAE